MKQCKQNEMLGIRRLAVCFLTAAGAVLLPFAAHADTLTWTGGGANKKWSTTANWSPAQSMTASDTANFQTGTLSSDTITYDSGAFAGITVPSGAWTVNVSSACFTEKPITISSGAKFALYATEEDAKEQKNALKTAVSDENGNVAFMGLAYGSFSADEEGKSINGVQNGKREYWIAEIEAPEHYSLMSGVARVEVNSQSHLPGNTKDIVNEVNSRSYLPGNTKDIVNSLIPTIPQTGGVGVVLIVIGCCCLVIYALFFLFIIRKYQSSKKQMKEHENE